MPEYRIEIDVDVEVPAMGNVEDADREADRIVEGIRAMPGVKGADWQAMSRRTPAAPAALH